MDISLRLGLGSLATMGGGGPSFDPDAEALFARFTTPPTDERKGLINDLIVALKTSTAWDALDVLYIRAAADSQAARLNWVADQYNSTAFSSPTFTPDRGFTPDGSASYLTSGFDPTTAGGKFTLDDAHMGVWHLTDLPGLGSTTSNDFGNANSRVVNSAVSATIVRSNRDMNTSMGSDNYASHKVWSRDGSASWRYFNAGTLVGDDPRTDPSVALTAADFSTGRINPGAYGNNEEAIAHWGSALSAAQIAAMRDAFATYLTAVGAI